MSRRKRLVWLAVLAIAIVAAAFAFVPPIAQPQWYHDFADRRAWLGIPNSLDVASNIFFLAVGVAGWARLSQARFADSRERWPYAVFFAGLVLTGFASAWYHLAPTDARLAWDRLAMSIAFAGFAAALLQERAGAGFGLPALAALLAAGPGAVLYWAASEAAGAGDMRAYFLLQGLILLLAPLLIGLLPGRYSRGGDWLAVPGLYALALALEWLDKPIFEATGSVSGHTFKHLAAALAGYWLLRHLRLRRLRHGA